MVFNCCALWYGANFREAPLHGLGTVQRSFSKVGPRIRVALSSHLPTKHSKGLQRCCDQAAMVISMRRALCVRRFQAFGHSWHGNYKMKIITLLLIHNGCASVVIGSFTAIAMMVLSSLGVFPGWVRDLRGEPMNIFIYAQGGGFIATLVTLLTWRSQRQVFLDRIRINQYDEDLKKASIYSLGRIIAKSQEMLVLWDSTWSERLWCQYEFSAFWSNRTEEQVLVILPTFLGPCSCIFFTGTLTIFML